MLREFKENQMPRLYSIDDDFSGKTPRHNPAHFFPSAIWTRGMSSDYFWKYDLEGDFPARSYIHCDDLDDKDTGFWIELRKDVERRFLGDVFYLYQRMDYRRWWNRNASEYSKEYERQRHGYWTFYFENEGDHAMFIMQHGERLSDKRYRFHPIMGISCEDHRYDVPKDEEVANAWRI